MSVNGKTNFNPKTHGFHFGNDFVNQIITIPGKGDIETYGRCGGMAFAALDYYFAGISIPGYTAADFAPDDVPPDGHWLADYIYLRLIGSFAAPSATKFVIWTLSSDHPTLILKGVTRWTKEDEFTKLRKAINAGRPVALGLVGAKTLDDIGNENHQVVAYGYEYDSVKKNITIYIYDNNSPDEEVLLVSDKDNPYFNASNRSELWRGFFIQNYTPVPPPVGPI